MQFKRSPWKFPRLTELLCGSHWVQAPTNEQAEFLLSSLLKLCHVLCWMLSSHVRMLVQFPWPLSWGTWRTERHRRQYHPPPSSLCMWSYFLWHQLSIVNHGPKLSRRKFRKYIIHLFKIEQHYHESSDDILGHPILSWPEHFLSHCIFIVFAICQPLRSHLSYLSVVVALECLCPNDPKAPFSVMCDTLWSCLWSLASTSRCSLYLPWTGCYYTRICPVWPSKWWNGSDPRMPTFAASWLSISVFRAKLHSSSVPSVTLRELSRTSIPKPPCGTVYMYTTTGYDLAWTPDDTCSNKDASLKCTECEKSCTKGHMLYNSLMWVLEENHVLFSNTLNWRNGYLSWID